LARSSRSKSTCNRISIFSKKGCSQRHRLWINRLQITVYKIDIHQDLLAAQTDDALPDCFKVNRSPVRRWLLDFYLYGRDSPLALTQRPPNRSPPTIFHPLFDFYRRPFLSMGNANKFRQGEIWTRSDPSKHARQRGASLPISSYTPVFYWQLPAQHSKQHKRPNLHRPPHLNQHIPAAYACSARTAQALFYIGAVPA
jgi:hypothetical protein